ncbi:MAG: hypothetical protein ACE5HE_08645, partial [Phycisphaerae bacterium]
GDTVTLTCSTGAVVPSGTRAIELIGAGDGQLTSVAEGVATFTAGSPGALTFRCVASSADGERVTSPNLTVTVAPSADGDGQLENVGGGSDAGDGAGGTDGNDNSDTNEGGGNGGGPSPRPPVRR